MSRRLIAVGLGLVVLGLAWPLIRRLGLGRLPGDVIVERDHLRLYIPLATCLLLSIILSLLAWLLRRFF